MDKILEEVEELKNMILNSKEYQNYIKYDNIISNNKNIQYIISEIKLLQKIVINKEEKEINKEKEEFELVNLFKELDSYDEYKKYIKYSKELNLLISSIQNRFEEYFNELIVI